MPDLVPTIIVAAATGLVVAALLFFVERGLAPRAWPFRPGAFAGPWAVGAGFAFAYRLALGAWPEFPATKAADWLMWIACGLAIAAPLLQLRFVHSIIGPAVLGLLAAGAVTEWSLRNVMTNTLGAGARGAWVVGIAAAMTLACAAGALALSATSRPTGGPRHSALVRLRDDHWGTFALGLMFAFAAPAVIFSSTIKLGQGMLGLGMAWAGVALVGLIFGLRLVGAGAAAIALYGCLWCATYFLADSSAMALALAALAPLGLLIGFIPALRGRPWARFVLTSAAAGGLAAASAGVLAPAYLGPEPEDEHAAVSGRPER
ncbi:MAG: hypothetical protein ACK4WH_14515 [Phycisphaerales bacterium]